MPQNKIIEVDFHGLDEQIHRFERIRSEIEDSMDRIMLRAASILEAEIKRQITNMGLVDTGTLRASVHSFVRKRFGATEGVAATNMEYAPFLEFGTGRRGAVSGHPAVPPEYAYGDSAGISSYKYMWTAWMNKKDEITAYVNTEIQRLVM